MANEAWVERQCRDADSRREYERERLLTWALEQVYEAMDQAGKTKADLARILGTSRANVTQILQGNRTITLRTLADFAWACDARIEVGFQPLRDGSYVSLPVALVRTSRSQITTTEPDDSDEESESNSSLAA